MRRPLVIVIALVVAAAWAHAARASEPLIAFDPNRGEFPEGIALDHRGALYVGLAPLGEIWRLSRDGDVELWIEHEALAGTAVLNPFPLGANGIAYSRGRLYVANTEKMQVVEI